MNKVNAFSVRMFNDADLIRDIMDEMRMAVYKKLREKSG